jgi:flagellar biosynthesis protein FliR
MDWLRQLEVEKLLLFTLVLTRVSGLLMTAPIYGTSDIPVPVRTLLAVALAVLVMPIQWATSFPNPGTMLHFLVIIASELLVGISLGLGVMILSAGIQMAGELMSRVGGLTLSDVFDPTFQNNVPLFSRLLFFVSTAVFVAIGGHRLLLGGLLDTFQTIPPGRMLAALLGPHSGGGESFLSRLLEMFVILVSESFHLGIRVAVPVVTAMLLATLVLGLISRTLPQLNILAIGFGLNAMLTFAVLFLSMGAAALAFQDQIEPTLARLMETFRVPTIAGP